MPASDHVVVFDLDDTLYKERDYVTSGVAAVTRECLALGLVDETRAMQPFMPDVAGGKVIDQLCNHLGLPDQLRPTLLWMYRLHRPDISLDALTQSAVQAIAARAKAVAVITDGRAVTQRLKLQALGLSHIPAYVSEEHTNGKPAPDMFLAVAARWPGCSYSYVGDNLAKDFVAPNALGWFTVGLRDDGGNIHPQSHSASNAKNVQPKAWVSNLAELPELVFGTSSSRDTAH